MAARDRASAEKNIYKSRQKSDASFTFFDFVLHFINMKKKEEETHFHFFLNDTFRSSSKYNRTKSSGMSFISSLILMTLYK